MKSLRERKVKELKEEVNKLPSKPLLGIYQVGDYSASQVYVRNKINLCKDVGLEFNLHKYDEWFPEEELIKTIKDFSNIEDGQFVQLPLPQSYNEDNVCQSIQAKNDIDGFTSGNIGKLFLGDNSGLFPCTVEGIIQILVERLHVDVKGKDVVIVGRSNIVGKPLALRLINMGATVTVCNSSTKNLHDKTKNCDILISAIGKAKFFDKSYFNVDTKQIIIDVGMNRDEHGKLCGDVDTHAVDFLGEKTITPVPGGVGLMTVVNVVANTIKAYKEKNERVK